MFEFIILSVIALAAGYWAALWLAGRREDVLHGHFVQTDIGPEHLSSPSAAATNGDRLQALLRTITQDLKDAAQI